MSQGAKHSHSEIEPIAQHIISVLGEYCHRIEVAGSIRRGRDARDIELVALPKRRTNLVGEPMSDRPTELDSFLLEKRVKFIQGQWHNKRKQPIKNTRFMYGRYKVDLFLPATPAHWGSIYFIRTGSSEFGKWVMSTRQAAVGVKFRQGLVYGMSQVIETPEEEDIFRILGMRFVPPQHRDDAKWLEYVLV